jgi:hypothetical protein
MSGTMSQTLFSGVVFESFSDAPDKIFGLDLTDTASVSPILDVDVSFLGNWTAKIHNPYSVWISAVGSSFSQTNLTVPIGLNGQYGDTIAIRPVPLKIVNFKPKIEVTGNFNPAETITIRVRLECIDNTYSPAIEKTFNNSSTIWFTDDELLEMFPSQNIVWAVIIDATSNTSNTNVTVKVSVYGISG